MGIGGNRRSITFILFPGKVTRMMVLDQNLPSALRLAMTHRLAPTAFHQLGPCLRFAVAVSARIYRIGKHRVKRRVSGQFPNHLYVRPAHEERRATKCSLLETIGGPGERCPVRSFYGTPAPCLVAHAGRDLFPVSRLAPNKTRQVSEFAVRHGEPSEEWLRTTAAGTSSPRIH